MTCNGIERRNRGWRVYRRCVPVAWFRSLFDARAYYYWFEARCINAVKETSEMETKIDDRCPSCVDAGIRRAALAAAGGEWALGHDGSPCELCNPVLAVSRVFKIRKIWVIHV